MSLRVTTLKIEVKYVPKATAYRLMKRRPQRKGVVYTLGTGCIAPAPKRDLLLVEVQPRLKWPIVVFSMLASTP